MSEEIEPRYWKHNAGTVGVLTHESLRDGADRALAEPVRFVAVEHPPSPEEARVHEMLAAKVREVMALPPEERAEVLRAWNERIGESLARGAL